VRVNWVKAGLILAIALMVNVASAQFTFYTAQDLGANEFGNVINDNTGDIPDVGDPNIDGFAPFAPLWYTWTAPHDGEVELDTVGSSNVDTVLGVYQGPNTTPKYLNQLAANDDLYPINRTITQPPIYSPATEGISTVFSFTNVFEGVTNIFGPFLIQDPPGDYAVTIPYYGPSHLRFNAKAGQKYYFAADTKFSTGVVSITWAYKSSGVFRFASEDVDPATGLPLYQTAETESTPPLGTGNVDVRSAVQTYYNYNAPGVLVTVTRSAGSKGRAVVKYQTVDGTGLPNVSLLDAPAFSNVDYVPVSGTLIFDDFETSKTILIPVIDHGSMLLNPFNITQVTSSNRVFGVQLIDDGGVSEDDGIVSPQLDPLEDGGSVSPPRVDHVFGTAVVKILDENADPRGPDVDTNGIPLANPTNLIFNFEKANYRVPADITDPAIAPYNYANVTLYVERFGTNLAGATINYRVDAFLNDDGSAEEYNNEFPLQPASDYAVPLPGNQNTIIRNYPLSVYDGVSQNYDFDLANGSISFPGGNNINNLAQPIHIKIPISKATKFNKDFRISLYREVKVGSDDVPETTGMNAVTTVTVLFNDENPPAGSVDEFYNVDWKRDMAVLPGTIASNTPTISNPGVGSPFFPGQIYSIAALTNEEALIGGAFLTYNGVASGGIALVTTNGLLDNIFNPGSNPNFGVSGDITQDPFPNPTVNGVAVSGNQFYIGGNFTAYNNHPTICLARLNANGTQDNAFSVGNGPNGVVRAIAVLPNGKLMVGGDFTNINGTPRNYIARLNTDGSVDAGFDPSNDLSGPVYSIALPIPTIVFNNAGGTNEVDQAIKMAPNANSGLLTVNSTMTSSDDLRVFYGTTNVAGGSGVLIYDSGNGFSGLSSVPFGPTNGISTNLITIVMNQGVSQITTWSYSGAITFPNVANGITVGGNFTVNGQIYRNVARLNFNGTLDNSFSPSSGADGTVHALGLQSDGRIVAGGEFTHVNGLNYNHIVRFNGDGSVDSTNFFVGAGADDIVYSVNVHSEGVIYAGGAFQSFNGSLRRGFARLYSNGTLDTRFMDTAYNQFAGLKKIFSDDAPAVFSSVVQENSGGVLIGGSFLQVGGGQADTNVCDSLDDELALPDFGSFESFNDPNLWAEPKTRDGVRNRTSFARLIGGSTPGPGNLGLNATTYSQNKSISSQIVDLVRNNGTLGPISANFSVTPGLALAGQDYQYQAAPPLDWIAWEYLSSPSRQREDGLWGVGGSLIDPLGLALPQADKAINNLSTVSVGIIANSANPGNLSAQFQLANPSLGDTFYLGGEGIPVGAALGVPSAPFTLIDDTTFPGQFGFVSTNYTATNITVVRSNGMAGVVKMLANTIASNSTATLNVDYRAVVNAQLQFNTGVASTNFNVTVLNSGTVTNIDKYVWLRLSQLTSLSGGSTPTFGITDAKLRIINPNSPGFVTLSASNYIGTINGGTLNVTVNRVFGSLGTLSVQLGTTNGPSAFNGTEFTGLTNTLIWPGGDVSPRTISIHLNNSGIVGGNKQFGVKLFNPTNNGVSAPAIMGVISNASLTISNDNSYGILQFSAPLYTVNENGDYATITVVRSGGFVGTVSANFTTSNGSNTTASNYHPTNGTLVFAPGVVTASFRVYPKDDGVFDPPPASFYFNVTLSNPANAVLGTLTNAQVQILDAESYNRPPGSPDTGFDADGMNAGVSSLALNSSGQIIAGGSFTEVGTTPRNRIARLNTDGTLDTGFLSGLSGANAAVNAVVCQTDNRILIGGAFTTIDDVNRFFIARLMTDGTPDTSFNPASGPDNVVNAVAETFAVSGTNLVRKIYIGGAFFKFDNNSSPGVERLNNNGAVDFSFNVGSGADGPVFTIAAYPTNSINWGKILVGGAFGNFNGTTVSNLVRLNSDGSVDTNFVAVLGSGASSTIRALAIQLDGAILVGGSFTNFNGTVANYITRLNSDGTVDTNFSAAASANGAVEAIVVQPDNRILVSGQFTLFNGVTRNHITRLLPTGATDLAINFGLGANGDIDTMVFQPNDGMIVLGGAFNQYNGQSYENIVRIYGGSVAGSGAFSFSTTEFQAHEDGVVAAITVLRTGGTSGTNSDGSGNVTVQFSTSDGSATNGINYIATSTNLTFVPGEVVQTVLVPVLDDFVLTTNLYLNLTLSNPLPPSTLGFPAIAVLTIIEDDTAVKFSLPAYSQFKNTPSHFAVIDVVRPGGNTSTSSVDYSTTTNGTAVIGVDYYPTNGTVTFNPGESDVQFSVPIINNTNATGNKTVGLMLTNAVNTTLIPPSNAVLTIIDTVTTPGQIFFSATNYTVNEGDGTASLTVLRTNGSTGAIHVTYVTVAGTAQPNVNYTYVSNVLTFLDGSTAGTITIPLVDNNLVQGPVSLSVVLSNPDNGATLTVPSSTTLTILDNDTGFAFLNATNFVRETNGVVPIFVQRIGGTNGGISVDFSTVNNGTAQAGVNYSPVSGTLNFAVNEMLKTISLPLDDDPQVTGDLTLGMVLSNPTNGTVLASPSNTVVVIQDADAGLSFTNSTMSVFKNVGAAAISVVCSNPSIEPVIVDSNTVPLEVGYSTVNGSAVAGIDYTPVNGTLVFSNGITTNIIYVPIINNSLVTGDHAFSVNLFNPTAPGKLVSPSNLVVTIVDDNSGLSFTRPVYTILKTGVSTNITVIRTDNTNQVSAVNFATSDGTASAGVDYIATNGVMVFTNGDVSKTFTVTVIANTTVQPDKTVLLQLSSPSNAFLIAPYAATLTIHDISGSLVVPAGSTLVHESLITNGIIDPGETVTMLLALRASGGTNIPNVNATLLVTNGITSPSPATAVNYGAMAVGGPAVSRQFSFTANGTNSQQIAATLLLDNGVTNIGTAVFTYTLGMWTNTFYNTNGITIPTIGIASPYPSVITVSNLGGTLVKSIVTLSNLYHTYPDDVHALVVSPAGQDTLLMSHTGGSTNAAKVTLTFDDAAATYLSGTNALTTSTNKPTHWSITPVFP